MEENVSERSMFPEMLPPQPQPWFELALRYLDRDQQRTIVARILDMHIMQQEQLLEVAKMARDMLKKGPKTR
ncbi:MAG: hypothetical protein WC600_07830 [Desulfobaccales bacterium]